MIRRHDDGYLILLLLLRPSEKYSNIYILTIIYVILIYCHGKTDILYYIYNIHVYTIRVWIVFGHDVDM